MEKKIFNKIMHVRFNRSTYICTQTFQHRQSERMGFRLKVKKLSETNLEEFYFNPLKSKQTMKTDFPVLRI